MRSAFVPAIVAVVLVAAFPARSDAQDDPAGFRSPTGNIHCQFFEDSEPSRAAMRCDLMKIDNRPGPRPRECDLEWGDAFEVTAGAGTGERLCHGDTARDDRLPVLTYGKSWERGGFVCRSERSGVTCVNAQGHGFEIARSRQRVF